MLNVVAVNGRLVAAPELRKTNSGVPVTSFTLAVDRSYVKAGAERQADFVDCVAWRGTAEFICKHFRKGQMMAVKGVLQTRTYTGTDGKKHKVMEVVAEEVSFADSKRPANDTSTQTTETQSPEQQDSADDVLDPEYEQTEFVEVPEASDEDLPF